MLRVSVTPELVEVTLSAKAAFHRAGREREEVTERAEHGLGHGL